MNGMGARGPAPKPIDLKYYEGFRGHHPIPSNVPIYPNGLPSKPAKLSPDASKKWDELVAEMSVSGVLKSVDGEALAQLCEDQVALDKAYGGFWKLAAKMKAKARREKRELPGGELIALISTPSGAKAFKAIRDMGMNLVVERREFGLTPSSRSRIIVSDAERPCDAIDDAVFNRPAKLLVLPPKP
jgi:phage terminase small subunit